jgi:hypothetical protein
MGLMPCSSTCNNHRGSRCAVILISPGFGRVRIACAGMLTHDMRGRDTQRRSAVALVPHLIRYVQLLTRLQIAWLPCRSTSHQYAAGLCSQYAAAPLKASSLFLPATLGLPHLSTMRRRHSARRHRASCRPPPCSTCSRPITGVQRSAASIARDFPRLGMGCVGTVGCSSGKGQNPVQGCSYADSPKRMGRVVGVVHEVDEGC